MKTNVIGFAVLSCLFAAGAANATDGTVNFTGEITSQTCTIEGTTSGTSTKTVALPKLSASSLAATGQTAGRTAFTLALTACTGTSATVHFEQRAAVDAATGNLINQTAGGSNAQIQILNASFAPINLQTNSGSLTTAVTNEAATLQFYAQYIAATAPATPGKVTSNVQFSMDYN
jgi:major type 1 subunit fimbrin (pilin)